MTEKFDHKLKVSISLLPVHTPDEMVWENIEKRLEFNDKLHVAASQMPSYEPEFVTWSNIEAKLNAKGSKYIRIKPVVYWMAAASFLIFLSVWFWGSSKKHEMVAFTEEVDYFWNASPHLVSDSTNILLMQFIDEQCKGRSYLCTEPDFTLKKQKLEDVEEQLKNLESVIENGGDSPSLIKTRIKLENFKAQLVKEIVNKLKSCPQQ